MPRKRKPTLKGITVIEAEGEDCPRVEIDWDKNEAYIVDNFGGVAKFSHLAHLVSLTSKVSVAMCGNGVISG